MENISILDALVLYVSIVVNKQETLSSKMMCLLNNFVELNTFNPVFK